MSDPIDDILRRAGERAKAAGDDWYNPKFDGPPNGNGTHKAAPVLIPPTIAAMPADLKACPQWVAWRQEWNGKRFRKIPVNPHDGSDAKTNDPMTWGTCAAAYQKYCDARLAGIGFVFWESDPYCGGDFDDCRDTETGEIAEDIHEWLTRLGTYVEISPSGTGVKFFGKAVLQGRGKNYGKRELYDRLRFFALTGERLQGFPSEPQPCQEAFDALRKECEATKAAANGAHTNGKPAGAQTSGIPGGGQASRPLNAFDRARRYAEKYPPAVSGERGHDRTYSLAMRLVEGFGLSRDEARAAIEEWNRTCQPPWSAREIEHKLTSAFADADPARIGYKLTEANPHLNATRNGTPINPTSAATLHNAAATAPKKAPPEPIERFTMGELLTAFPKLRPPIIDGILRQGETMNLIAAPKVGKSWQSLDLALSVATGRHWLESFATTPGRVLLIDNELHRETLAHRLRTVAAARQIAEADVNQAVEVVPLRGRLKSLDKLAPLFESLKPGEFTLIILDAFYRALPAGCRENENEGIKDVYNLIDHYTDRLQAGFVNIHHASKGNQAGKSVTDTGSGAGSLSRAADAHLVLRQHEEPDAVVLEAAVRSFPPIAPICLRWAFPFFEVACDLDPSKLKDASTRQDAASETQSFIAALNRADPKRAGITANQLLTEIGWGRTKLNRVIKRLLGEKTIEQVPVRKAAGNGKLGDYVGIRLAS